MQADVGIAIGAGTDIAIESADVVLIGERLGAVVDAYYIGKASYRKTVQNLLLALTFNGIGVPFAVTGLVHPIWAMVAMAASVTTVLTNSFGGKLLPHARRGGRRQLRFTVANMHCERCVAAIKEAACKVAGVEDVSGDPSTHLIIVTYREDGTKPEGIQEAISSAALMRGPPPSLPGCPRYHVRSAVIKRLTAFVELLLRARLEASDSEQARAPGERGLAH